MDGTLFSPWARNDNPKKLAKKLAGLVNCPTEPTSDLVECLRQLPATDLAETVYELCVSTILSVFYSMKQIYSLFSLPISSVFSPSPFNLYQIFVLGILYVLFSMHALATFLHNIEPFPL
jgi:hypothetical protein